MLANLDNEVHFKKVFTDVDVFRAFVKDVLGIDMNITKVETEKVLPKCVNPPNLSVENTLNITIVSPLY